jgi:hypothetical protein
LTNIGFVYLYLLLNYFPRGQRRRIFKFISAIDVMLVMLDPIVEDSLFQSNLYATQKNKNQSLERHELLSFLGIHFLWATTNFIHGDIIGPLVRT